MPRRLRWDRQSDGRLLAFSGRLLVAVINPLASGFSYRLRAFRNPMSSEDCGIRASEKSAKERVQALWVRFLKKADILPEEE